MKKVLYFLIVLSFLSCKKDPPTYSEKPKEEGRDVIVNFTNVADNLVVKVSKDSASTASTPKYITANNDTLSVVTLKYYISNIKLKRTDGTYYTETESYHLINAADSTNSCKFTLKDVPIANYVSIEFMLGVDSLRNVSGAQAGQLAPVYDMFWNWNTGYIFFKLEGYSSAPNPPNTKNIIYHVGGFKLPYNNLSLFNLSFPTVMEVHDEHVSKIFVKANIMECFRTPVLIDLVNYNSGMTPSSAKTLVDNYKDMFTVSAIKHQ